MHSQFRTTVLIVLVVVGGLIAGCQAGPGDEPSSSASTDPAAELRRVVEGEQPDEHANREEEYTRRRNEIMAGCMKKAGFDYRPVAPPTTPQRSLGLSDDDFVKQYGFGISTLIDLPQTQIQPPDPNAEIRRTLSAAAQRSYDKAVGTCAVEVLKELGSAPGVVRLPADSDLAKGIREASERANSDPRVVAARKEYQKCVAALGFTGDAGEALRGRIEERVAPYRQAFEARVADLHRRGADPSKLRISDVLDARQMADLQQIQQSELKAAAADRACGAPLYRIAAEVQREYMRKLVEGIN